jgi:hypothetical protein
VRVLKIAVIAMGILLAGGFVFVLATIVYQASQLSKESAASTFAPAGVETEFAMPPDAAVSLLALDGDRLALHLRSSAGPEIVVIDLATAKVLTRVKLKPR